MLAIENLTVSYGTEVAVKNVSLTVSGEVVCLCGRNGSGKSTPSRSGGDSGHRFGPNPAGRPGCGRSRPCIND